ncbi:MAG: hypothetical protein CVU71_07355 [Deltaproteobacteria bacterium HGW-Deltaproteobacteria-6]|jgi:hypothetical protein|nr:MAG: hypothetical protein CVU71_07355 [Deltaproteobacteria bacterium HGW-Deltaproteobacteria-6]
MDKRVKIFLIVSAIFIIAAYAAALKLDTFATGIVTFIAMVYFGVTGLKAVIQMVRTKETGDNLIIGLGCIVAFFIMFHAVSVSDQGLQELTKQRMQTLSALRPVLIKYKTERGNFPDRLQDLVPLYLRTVPPELVNDGKEDAYKKITYEVRKGEARFVFSRTRGPDARVTYHVHENKYEHAR